ncbi:MAG: hypothetical protein KDC95_07700 [Planctomycetes bacterium]|nr:hypothetical protein [Planctomycetota bacterium]
MCARGVAQSGLRVTRYDSWDDPRRDLCGRNAYIREFATDADGRIADALYEKHGYRYVVHDIECESGRAL